ncbi:MAG: hypothetical protein JWM89_1267 [Acidimicrobiales bacterium]|nr:hypothetical protein [Acidimicrobiales bacterium]
MTYRVDDRTRAGRGRRFAKVGVLVAAFSFAGSAVAFGAIPDAATNTIFGCYTTATGALRVIDPGAGQSCAAGQVALNWSQQSLSWKGAWSNALTYAKQDVVSQNGASYISKVDGNLNFAPAGNAAKWGLLAAKGATGPAGPMGATGLEGPTGPAGSPDTPQEVLDKIVQVDGQGSGLDSSFLDGIDSTGFLRNNGKAVDADKLDGLNSTAFATKATKSSGSIGLTAIPANTCKDIVLGIANVLPGDIVTVRVKEGDTIPARLTFHEMDVPAAGKLNMRVCNGTSAASLADSDIQLRWYALR